MFRPMKRYKQQLSEGECIELLKTVRRGVLSVLGDEGYPYGTPINQWYCEEEGVLYFHSGRTGHRIDALRREEKASFCLFDEGYRKEGEWALNIRSVIAFGRIFIVEDHERALEISRQLSYQFTSDRDYIEREVRRSGPGVLVYGLKIQHMTGKLVNEA